MTPEYKAYAAQVRKNAAALAKALIAKKHKLATDGTDNHLILWDLRPHVRSILRLVSVSLMRCAPAEHSRESHAGAVRPPKVLLSLP